MFDGDYDDEHDDEIAPLELPWQSDMNAIFMVAEFFIEQDRKEKRLMRDVSKAVDALYDKYGSEVATALMSYVQRREGWDLEILLEKSEVEDHLLKKYSLYDDDIWTKIVGTETMYEYRKRVFQLSQTYLDLAVQEVLEREQPNMG